MKDAFTENIRGVDQLVNSDINKNKMPLELSEGVEGDFEDALTLKMEDRELLLLKTQWENKSAPYHVKIQPRQETNKTYYLGHQRRSTGGSGTIPSNILFEAEETFIPQALSKNPEPVVWSDNTEEGKLASNELKTMLQFHADVLCMRKKLGMMLRHWSIYLIGVVKHGWDDKIGDITTEIRKPKNFIFDPDGYIDEFGNYVGEYLGERIQSSAEELMKLFPESKSYILIKCDGKLGTQVVRTEWWTDEYCFTTFGDVVLDKHKNQFFNYDKEEENTDEYGIKEKTNIGGKNHFAVPKMPYTFLSVFSLQEQPHDVTNLIEQNIANQDTITDRDEQITKNLKHGNNSIAVSGLVFSVDTAKQAANALEVGNPVLVPGGQIEQAIKRIPANPLPNGIIESQEIAKNTLRGVFGTLGLSAQNPNEDTTARGMILNKNMDSTRIGGGVGDALEQVADNIFNWWTQLYYVFYDQTHYAAIMGSGRAVEYVQLMMAGQDRHFVVSVSPNSMAPKDEITEMNQAIDLANKGWLDPLNLFKKLNYPDPIETAKAVTLFKIDPMAYMQKYFPEQLPQQPMGGGVENPPNLQTNVGQPADTGLAQEPQSASLSQVPLQQ